MAISERQPLATTLVAILIAARHTKDRLLERYAREKLETDYRMQIRFLSDRKEARTDGR